MSNKRQMRFNDGESIDGLESRLVFDQTSMKGSAKYFLNGVECPQIKLDSMQSKLFANYALIKKDLKFCKQALKIAISLAKSSDDLTSKGQFRAEFDEESDILKAMYISFVVTYGKCFTKADGRRVKLETKEIFEDDEVKEEHLSVMTQRHEYIAHGGKTNLEQVEPIVILHPDISENFAPLLTTQSFHLAGLSCEHFESLFELVIYVDKYLDQLLEKKSKALVDKEITTFTLEELYKKALV